MAGELLQHLIVTAAALGAGVVVVRRLIGVVGTKSGKAGGCDHCTTVPGASASRRSGPSGSGVHPLTVIRPSRR